MGPVTVGANGEFRLGGEDGAVEWVLKMRRFDQAALYDRMAEEGRLALNLMPRLAETIAAFHDSAVRVLSAGQAIERLERATRGQHHVFWPCAVSLLEARTIDRERLHGPRQVTDAYLLALAVAHDARFVTFDGAIPLAAVAGAGVDQLVVL